MKVTNKTKQLKPFNINYRKEKGFTDCYVAVSIVDGQIKELGEMRLYCPSNDVYCCIWVHDSLRCTGRAGGCGYDKSSAAAWDALNNAGFEFDKDFSGAGESAMIKAFKAAILFETGLEVEKIIHTHP